MDLGDRKLVVANGESLTLGKHVLTFVFAPMVHWPEVMVTYDSDRRRFCFPQTDLVNLVRLM